jgi:hypothetical protein
MPIFFCVFLQALLETRDERGTRISGEAVFKDALMPDIQVMMAACTNLAGTNKDYCWDMKNSSFQALYIKAKNLIDSGRVARAAGKRTQEAVHQVSREVDNAGTAANQVTQGSAILSKTMHVRYHNIDHYRFGEDGVFRPAYSSVQGHSVIRIYKGDWRAMLKLEAERDGGLCIPGMYLDVPWGVHPKRKEDAVKMTADEVSFFTCIQR